MTVREWAKNKSNNGTYQVYKRSTKMYVNPQTVWDEEVLKINEHRGWGYKQIDVVLHIR